MSAAHHLGTWGENTARIFLEQCGYQCLDRRYRRPGGEIDLVMRKSRTLVFVEVKTRGPGAIAPASEGLSRQQKMRLRRMALSWLHAHQDQSSDVLRFDLVAIDIADNEGGATLQHFVAVA